MSKTNLSVLSGGNNGNNENIFNISASIKNVAHFSHLFGHDEVQIIHDEVSDRFSASLDSCADSSVAWAPLIVETGVIALHHSATEGKFDTIAEFLESLSLKQMADLFSQTFSNVDFSTKLRLNPPFLIIRSLLGAPRSYFVGCSISCLSPSIIFKLLTTLDRSDNEADDLDSLYDTAEKTCQFFKSICDSHRDGPSFADFSLYFLQYHMLLALPSVWVSHQQSAKETAQREARLAARHAGSAQKSPPPPLKEEFKPPPVVKSRGAATGAEHGPPPLGAQQRAKKDHPNNGKSVPARNARTAQRMMYNGSSDEDSSGKEFDSSLASLQDGMDGLSVLSALSYASPNDDGAQAERRWRAHTERYPPNSPGSHASGVPHSGHPIKPSSVYPPYPPAPHVSTRLTVHAPAYLNTEAYEHAYDCHEQIVQRENPPSLSSLSEAMAIPGGHLIPTVQGLLLDMGFLVESFNTTSGTYKNRLHLSAESKLLVKLYNPDADSRIEFLKPDFSLHYPFYSIETLNTFLNHQLKALSDSMLSRYVFIATALSGSHFHNFRQSISRIGARYLSHEPDTAPHYIVALATYMRFVWRTWSLAFAKRSFDVWSNHAISESWRHTFFQELTLVQVSVVSPSALSKFLISCLSIVSLRISTSLFLQLMSGWNVFLIMSIQAASRNVHIRIVWPALLTQLLACPSASRSSCDPLGDCCLVRIVAASLSSSHAVSQAINTCSQQSPTAMPSTMVSATTPQQTPTSFVYPPCADNCLLEASSTVLVQYGSLLEQLFCFLQLVLAGAIMWHVFVSALLPLVASPTVLLLDTLDRVLLLRLLPWSYLEEKIAGPATFGSESLPPDNLPMTKPKAAVLTHHNESLCVTGPDARPHRCFNPLLGRIGVTLPCFLRRCPASAFRSIESPMVPCLLPLIGSRSRHHIRC